MQQNWGFHSLLLPLMAFRKACIQSAVTSVTLRSNRLSNQKASWKYANSHMSENLHCGINRKENLPANAGDARDSSLIPGLGRSSGVGNGNPLQYSCLGNSVNRGAWWAAVHGVTKRYNWVTEHACTWATQTMKRKIRKITVEDDRPPTQQSAMDRLQR